MTLLTFNNKYVVASTNAATTTSTSLVDDPYASQTFTLDSSKVVLVIYQANNVYNTSMPVVGMQNAIRVDDLDRASSWDSPYGTNLPVRNCVFWVGTLESGSHTIKGRFASKQSGSTATISNRVLLIYIFDGNEFQYIDSASTASTSNTTMTDDPYAQVTFTPSGVCKALILYNATNSGATENNYGKKVAVNVGGTDYGQAEKSPDGANAADSVFTVHALSLSAVSTTVKGRFANAGATATVTIHRRQLAVLLLDSSTLLDIVTSTTQVSTTSSTLVDDAQATISRTTTDTRELLVVAMGTKRSGVSSSTFGECYGIKIDAADRTNSRGSPFDATSANSAATAYAEELTAGSHTIKGRFSNNYGSELAVISARQVVALWFSIAVTYSLTLNESMGLVHVFSKLWIVSRIYREVSGLADFVSKFLSLVKVESVDLMGTILEVSRLFWEMLESLDNLIKSSLAIKSETPCLIDTLSEAWSTQRILERVLSLSGTLEKSVTLFKAQTLQLLDSKMRLVFRVFTETLAFWDYVSKNFIGMKRELLNFIDYIKQVLKGLLSAEVDTAEVDYSLVGTLLRTATEVPSFLDEFSFTLSLGLTLSNLEFITLLGTSFILSKKSVDEIATFLESTWRLLSVVKKESQMITEVLRFTTNYFRTLLESILTSGVILLSLLSLRRELLVASELMKKTLVKTFYESTLLASLSVLTPAILREELMATLELLSKSFLSLKSEVQSLVEVLQKSFVTCKQELFQVFESNPKAISLFKIETFSIIDIHKVIFSILKFQTISFLVIISKTTRKLSVLFLNALDSISTKMTKYSVEALSLIEIMVKRTWSVFLESLTFISVFSRIGSFQRLIETLLSLSESRFAALLTEQRESLLLSLIFSRTVNFVRISQEILSSLESKSIALFKSLAEEQALIDFFRTVIQFLKIEITSLTTYFKTESLMFKQETASLAVTLSKQVKKLNTQLLGFIVSYFIELEKLTLESLNLIPIISRTANFFRVLGEMIGFFDAISILAFIGQIISEVFQLIPMFAKTVFFSRTLVEEVINLDNMIRRITHWLVGFLQLQEITEKGVRRILSAVLVITDAYSKTWNIYRSLIEVSGLTELTLKILSSIRTEFRSLSDQMSKYGSLLFVELTELSVVIRKNVTERLSELLTSVSSLVLKTFISFHETLSEISVRSLEVSKTSLETLVFSLQYSFLVLSQKVETLVIVKGFSTLRAFHRQFSELVRIQEVFSRSVNLIKVEFFHLFKVLVLSSKTVKTEFLHLPDILSKSTSSLRVELLSTIEFISKVVRVIKTEFISLLVVHLINVFKQASDLLHFESTNLLAFVHSVTEQVRLSLTRKFFFFKREIEYLKMTLAFKTSGIFSLILTEVTHFVGEVARNILGIYFSYAKLVFSRYKKIAIVLHNNYYAKTSSFLQEKIVIPLRKKYYAQVRKKKSKAVAQTS